MVEVAVVVARAAVIEIIVIFKRFPVLVLIAISLNKAFINFYLFVYYR